MGATWGSEAQTLTRPPSGEQTTPHMLGRKPEIGLYLRDNAIRHGDDLVAVFRQQSTVLSRPAYSMRA